MNIFDTISSKMKIKRKKLPSPTNASYELEGRMGRGKKKLKIDRVSTVVERECEGDGNEGDG